MNIKDATTLAGSGLPSGKQESLYHAEAEWVKMGRHDLAALFHGLRDLRDVGAWALLVAHYLSAPGPLGETSLVDILDLEPARADRLSQKLLRLRRIRVEDAQLFIPLIDEKLIHAAHATANGKALAKKRWKDRHE